ncbi:helix-turn-helix transcriptional regulator [bacterium]|nr:helix-turn-helix transcriptional regulator [bacterium]
MARREFLKGTIEMVILSLLKKEDMYGYQILRRLKEESPDMLGIKEGTLYPLLLRMMDHGWIAGKWIKAGERRKRHYYSITSRGVAQLKETRAFWKDLTAAVGKVIRATA